MQLKLCPHCSSYPRLSNHSDIYWIQCRSSTCLARSSEFFSAEEAAEKWNCRFSTGKSEKPDKYNVQLTAQECVLVWHSLMHLTSRADVYRFWCTEYKEAINTLLSQLEFIRKNSE